MTSTVAATGAPLLIDRRSRRCTTALPRRCVRTSAGATPPPLPPVEEFAPLAAVFRRRLALGAGAASLVAFGANFAGVTSLLLGLDPELGRRLKLDALYPVQGYTRWIDTDNGFEFIYPAKWVGDQTLLYRAVGREESRRQLDPPSLDATSKPHTRSVNEPVVAFGPPGTTGELNVSVIVSPVPLDFSIEAFGGPKEVGETVVRSIVGRRGLSDVKGFLVNSTVRHDGDQSYYALEIAVESLAFRRHNVAVCSVRKGRLFTLNAQAPESIWSGVKDEFYRMADSFTLTL